MGKYIYLTSNPEALVASMFMLQGLSGNIIRGEYEKHMKTVQRSFSGTLLYRTISSGFYVGSKDGLAFYAYPSMKDIENANYEFFREI